MIYANWLHHIIVSRQQSSPHSWRKLQLFQILILLTIYDSCSKPTVGQWQSYSKSSPSITKIQLMISQLQKLFFVYELVENQPSWPCSGAREKHCSQSGCRVKSLHTVTITFYVTKHRGAYESDRVVCVCVCVCCPGDQVAVLVLHRPRSTGKQCWIPHKINIQLWG